MNVKGEKKRQEEWKHYDAIWQPDALNDEEGEAQDLEVA